MASVFTSVSDIIVAISNYGELRAIYKDARVGAAAAAATVAGQVTSLWQYDGSPSDGAAPTTVVAPTRTTAGAMGQANAGSPRNKYLMHVAAASGQSGTLMLYDRLLTIGNLSGTTTGNQTVGGALTRNTVGTGNQIFAEIYTAVGATGTTITASYSNTVPTSGRTTASVTFGGVGFQEVQRMIYLPLQSTDHGVSAVASASLVASTLAAGAWGITVAHPLVTIPLGPVASGVPRDFIAGIPDFPLISANACLAWLWLANTVTAPQVYATCQFAEH